ncbi:MAG: FtsX-like permease family protein [Lachnospiraceae bacterium]
MKPFSAGYFIKKNRMRSSLLVFMFILSYIAYLGGLYVTNIRSMFDYSLERMDRYAILYPVSDDTDFEQFEKANEAVSKETGITLFQQGVVSSLNTDSIMGFENQYLSLSFRSVEDFKTFCQVVGIKCDFENLKGGSLIMSSLEANNRGMKIGDVLKEEEDESVYGSYTLDAITDEEGYSVYYIDAGKNGSNLSYILLAENMTESEFATYLEKLGQQYKIDIRSRKYFEETLDRQLGSFNYIYLFIVVLVSVVMAVTINAAFVGMYQQRQPEFAIYRAIGISKRRIVGKVAGELLLLDAIGMIAGGALLLLGVYLLNQLYLIPRGLILFYYHPIALSGMLFCNLMVLIPLLVTRSRQLLRADICTY